MSAEEKAVRDAAISKIAEMRKEVRKLVAAIDAVEIRVRSQPLSEKLQMGTPLRAVEGWVQSLMESHAVLAFCQDDVGAPRRYEDFAKQLSMTIDNWRASWYNSTMKEVVVLPAQLPAKTIKGHDDVRRVLAKRNGKPFELGPRTVDPHKYPGWQGEPIRSR